MCQNYLPKDTVNQCVKFVYQKTQTTNNTKLYKAHSFRIGFATEASHKGYFTETIRSLGRWKCDAYKLYLL
jgi:hypothetical protein